MSQGTLFLEESMKKRVLVAKLVVFVIFDVVRTGRLIINKFRPAKERNHKIY